jgi:hypothetical protein
LIEQDAPYKKVAPLFSIDQHRILPKPSKARSERKIPFQHWLHIKANELFISRQAFTQKRKPLPKARVIVLSFERKCVGSDLMLLVIKHPFFCLLISEKEDHRRLKFWEIVPNICAQIFSVIGKISKWAMELVPSPFIESLEGTRGRFFSVPPIENTQLLEEFAIEKGARIHV